MAENSQGRIKHQLWTLKRRISSRLTPRFTIGVRFVTFVALVAILAGGVVGFMTINTSYDLARQSILNNNLIQADVMASYFSNYMEVLQSHLKVFALRPDVREFLFSRTTEKLSLALGQLVEFQTPLNGAGIYDVNGIQIAYSTNNATTIGQSFADRDWFQQVMATKKPYLGTPVKSKGTGVPIASFAVPILDEKGQVGAVLSGGISLARLADTITNISQALDSSISIIDLRGNGITLIDSTDLQRFMTPISRDSGSFKHLLDGERGTTQIFRSTGEFELVGFSSVVDLPWGITVTTLLKSVPENYPDFIQNTGISIGLVIIFASIIGVLLVLGITRPLKQLIEGAREIGRGNLNYKIDTMVRGEIGDLSLAFKRMTDELKKTTVSRDELAAEVIKRQSAEKEIRQLNTELERRVLDRTAQLEASNKELDAFSYSVSHDLRAPLRGIDGWSLALLDDYKDKLDEKGYRYLGIVRAEAQRMGKLIDDLLMFSRQGRSGMERQQLNMTEIVQTIVSSLKQRYPALRSTFVIQPGLTALGDMHLMEIALSNLLDNAVKFSGKNSSSLIEFGETEKEGSRAFFVRDNGVGFDMAFAHKLFGVFQRLHRSSEFPGTGIGLATVQRIINRHGGRIWAEAQVNRGATFYFTLKEDA